MTLSNDDRARLRAYLSDIQINVTAGRELLDEIEINVTACRAVLGTPESESPEAETNYEGEGGQTGGGGGGGPVRGGGG